VLKKQLPLACFVLCVLVNTQESLGKTHCFQLAVNIVTYLPNYTMSTPVDRKY